MPPAIPTRTVTPRDYNPRLPMALLRALSYFLKEALTSLWRSRLINAVSVGTIAVSLFVLGAFLTVASTLSGLVTRWTREGPGDVYLEDGLEARVLARASRTACATTPPSRRSSSSRASRRSPASAACSAT